MSDLPLPEPDTRTTEAERVTTLSLASGGAQAGAGPSPLDADDAGLWDLLLDSIDQRSVVPIVGRDLLTVPVNGQNKLLYLVLAEKLADVLKVPREVTADSTTSPLNAVAAEFILKGGEPDDIYAALQSISRGLGDLPPPESLRRLASIDRFSLFVTTTFDGLLASALAAAHDGQVRVSGFSSRARASTNDDFDPDAGPLVYHLFGRLSSLQDYVVTEEDALEFVFLLQSARNQPVQLLHQLSQRTLLIVGCSFPTWFVRVFLRLSRGRRLLWAPRERVAFIVDRGATADPGLLQFLKVFKTRTEVFTRYSPPEFVDELWRRWQAHTGGAAVEQAMEPGAVFVSYASEDRDAARRVVDGLRARGVKAWFDQQELQPGDRWKAKITANIDMASAFVPIISRTSTRSTLREFLYEWRLAIERSALVATDDTFIFPVVIDDVKSEDPAIPEAFREVNWTSLEGDAVPDALVDALNVSIRRKKVGARR
jgi:hypothetical protein